MSLSDCSDWDRPTEATDIPNDKPFDADEILRGEKALFGLRERREGRGERKEGEKK